MHFNLRKNKWDNFDPNNKNLNISSDRFKKKCIFQRSWYRFQHHENSTRFTSIENYRRKDKNTEPHFILNLKLVNNWNVLFITYLNNTLKPLKWSAFSKFKKTYNQKIYVVTNKVFLLPCLKMPRSYSLKCIIMVNSLLFIAKFLRGSKSSQDSTLLCSPPYIHFLVTLNAFRTI